MRKGLLTQMTWAGRRWLKDWFWDQERMAEHEQLRRELADLVRRTTTDPVKIRIRPPRLGF